MLKDKRGASIISLVLCAVAITLVITALVVATNNSAVYRAQIINRNSTPVQEISAYTKIYEINEVRTIANQAFVNNYLSFYDNEVDFQGFKALVIGEIMQTVPQNQLENYDIAVSSDGVNVYEK